MSLQQSNDNAARLPQTDDRGKRPMNDQREREALPELPLRACIATERGHGAPQSFMLNARDGVELMERGPGAMLDLFTADQMRVYARAAIAACTTDEPVLTDDDIDRIQDECDCFCSEERDIRVHEFARAIEEHVRRALAAPAHLAPAGQHPSAALRKFLDAAGAEGLVLDGVDAGDLFVALFPSGGDFDCNCPRCAAGEDAPHEFHLESRRKVRVRAPAGQQGEPFTPSDKAVLDIISDGRFIGDESKAAASLRVAHGYVIEKYRAIAAAPTGDSNAS